MGFGPSGALDFLFFFASVFLPKWLSTEVYDLLPRIHLDQRSESTSALQIFDGSITIMSHHLISFDLWGCASMVWSNPTFTPQFL
jgi:hypothetical protein